MVDNRVVRFMVVGNQVRQIEDCNGNLVDARHTLIHGVVASVFVQKDRELQSTVQ